MDACIRRKATLRSWVPDEFLLEHGRVDGAPPLARGSGALAADRVIVSAPSRRPDPARLAETVRGTLARGDDAGGAPPTREAELLAAWHGRG